MLHLISPARILEQILHYSSETLPVVRGQNGHEINILFYGFFFTGMLGNWTVIYSHYRPPTSDTHTIYNRYGLYINPNGQSDYYYNKTCFQFYGSNLCTTEPPEVGWLKTMTFIHDVIWGNGACPKQCASHAGLILSQLIVHQCPTLSNYDRLDW